ncbi:MAG TPA: hypothetical protein DDW52_11615 [Planctomycetaceae bacterium]|nr:hypothetical protein [Planctomycetaceae bacterium]
MLNVEQLKTLPVCGRAIHLLPESIARENCILPVAINCSTLHLIVPADYQSKDVAGQPLLELLRFILARELTFELAYRVDLSSFVDLHYRAVYSTIANCDHRFTINCPGRWVDLPATENVRVRFCNVCRKDVHFCNTTDEVESYFRLDHRVAINDADAERETLGLPYRDEMR